jgi:catechol 2,3-dioxygenase-like lactoylglutathione lyase family enzyme
MSFDHVSIRIPKKVMPKLLKSYSDILELVDIKEAMRFGVADGAKGLVVGMGNLETKDYFLWLAETEEDSVTPVHLAIKVPNRKKVDECHAKALECGLKDNGAPGLRAHYHPNFYGAYVIDEAGNNLEFVCHKPEDCQTE